MPRRSSPSLSFTVTVAPSGHEVRIVPDGDLDLTTAHQVSEAVRDQRRAGFDDIVLDLRRVEFIDSRGLLALIELRNDAQRNSHRLRMCPPKPPARRIFDITATRGLFEWLPDWTNPAADGATSTAAFA